MATPPKFWIVAACTAALVAFLLWTLGQGFGRRPVSISEASLSNWTLVVSDGTDPRVVAARPPASLTSELSRLAIERSGKTLSTPPRPVVPLVLRSEFDAALQGVYGVDEVLRIARDAGVDTALFRPVCIGRKTSSHPSATAYFVLFESQAFTAMRVALTPTEPEHAGIGTYDPSTVASPVLLIGATDAAFDRWWPLAVDRAMDCQAGVETAN